jgi:hypothetical protein
MFALSARAQTQPVTLDLSSPKAAAKSLVNAVEAGDGKAVRKIMLAEGPEQEKLADAFSDLIIAGHKLTEAARAKFGSAGDELGQGMITKDDIASIESAKVEEKGDRATLTIPGQSKPMSFQKKDGNWELVVMEFAGAAPEAIVKQRALLAAVTHALDEAADEITSGRYTNVNDAKAAVTAKLNNAMVKNFQPTTAPSSQPS